VVDNGGFSKVVFFDEFCVFGVRTGFRAGDRISGGGDEIWGNPGAGGGPETPI